MRIGGAYKVGKNLELAHDGKEVARHAISDEKEADAFCRKFKDELGTPGREEMRWRWWFGRECEEEDGEYVVVALEVGERWKVGEGGEDKVGQLLPAKLFLLRYSGCGVRIRIAGLRLRLLYEH